MKCVKQQLYNEKHAFSGPLLFQQAARKGNNNHMETILLIFKSDQLTGFETIITRSSYFEDLKMACYLYFYGLSLGSTDLKKQSFAVFSFHFSLNNSL